MQIISTDTIIKMSFNSHSGNMRNKRIGETKGCSPKMRSRVMLVKNKMVVLYTLKSGMKSAVPLHAVERGVKCKSIYEGK